jgi:hypothetical protein
MATSFSKDDFRRIRLSLAAAIVMAAAGGGIVYASLLLHQAEKKNQAMAQAKRAEIQGKLMRARDEELEVKNKIARYNELSKRGVFGEELRLDWVERIRRIKTERKLFDIQYEIAPQQAVDAAMLPGSSANFDFLSSSMQMRMKLLHEEDLLNFLTDLRASAQAYLRVRRCDVERLPKATGESRGIPPQLSADCTIDWVTIRERTGA